MKWTRTARGWWRLSFEAIKQKHLDLIHEIPGVTVVGHEIERGYVKNCSVSAHRSAFFAPAFEQFFEETESAPEHDLRDDPYQDTLWAPAERVLRDYQEDGIAWLVDGGSGLLCDEPGVGKSLQAICAAESWMGARRDAHAIIIGPKFTRAVWRHELIAAGAIKDASDFFFAEGKKPDPEHEERMRDCRYWFFHYDVLEPWRHIILRPLMCERPMVCLIDEAHWMRNPKSKRGQAARVVGTSIRHRIALTGTPILNTIDDMWALLTVVSGEGAWGTLFAFKKRYTNMLQGDHGWQSTGTRNMDEFKARLQACFLRRTCDIPAIRAQIPQLTRVTHWVDAAGVAIDPELRKFIGKDRTLALVKLREHLERSAFGAETLAMLMAWRKWTSRAKLVHTSEYAASLALEGEHVVIFCWERATCERLAELISKAAHAVEDGLVRVVTVHGGIDQDGRDALVAQFQASTKPQVLIATLDSLKEGVTLHRARYVIQHDIDYEFAKLLQSEARINRLGQKRRCTAVWVGVQNSADEIIIEHLVRKARDTADAIDDFRGNEALDELGLNVRDRGSEDAERLLKSLLAS